VAEAADTTVEMLAGKLVGRHRFLEELVVVVVAKLVAE